MALTSFSSPRLVPRSSAMTDTMATMTDTTLDPLARRVVEGLSGTPKSLPCMYFYDDAGSHLFQQIMQLPEYYLSRAEHTILREQTADLLALCSPLGQPFDLIELGCGDGSKTLDLCAGFLACGADVVYRPIDISRHALDSLHTRFAMALPRLKVAGLLGDYFDCLVHASHARRRVVMFMGSNLGNFTPREALQFLVQIRRTLQPHDALMLGLDLVKHPRRILAAYDDAQGVTAAFNHNLLHRLNREFEMDFDVRAFSHYASYCPLEATARSFLVSERAQRVHSRRLQRHFPFAQGECLYTEQSRKFALGALPELAREAGFDCEDTLTDPAGDVGVTFWSPR